MGGGDSEVSERTTDVVLECAYFDPKRIRATRKALRMDTEASYRFERGTDLQAVADVVRRAVALIRTVAGGEERDPPVDVYPEPVRPRVVFLRPERVERLLGVRVPREEIERHLTSVGFAVAPKDGRLHVQVPGWRPDVTREVDLIEEVARLKGYDAFPVELRPFRASTVPDDPVEALKDRLRRVLTGMGLHEARTMPLMPAQDHAATVAVLNPLSQDHSALRPSLLPGLLRAVEQNWSVRQREIRLFEIGAAFQRSADGRLLEQLRLAAVVSGARVPPHWTNGFRPPDYDVWDLKAMFAEAARLAGPPGQVIETDGGWLLRGGDGRQGGWAGVLQADGPKWSAMVYGFELDVSVTERPVARFVGLPTTPSLERDLALVLPDGLTAREVEAVLREAGAPLLEGAWTFDEFRHPELAGRSVAWRLVFRVPDRTLRDEEVDPVVERMVTILKERLGVARREA
jgi:phenylalanyl-tRNA synthetase beta chain